MLLPKKVCSICGKPFVAKGFCENHYYEFGGKKEKRRIKKIERQIAMSSSIGSLVMYR